MRVCPLSKLRLRDELVEIDCDALRFGADEARSLLNEVGGLALSSADVAALTASTDGWAAGLRLATLFFVAVPTPQACSVGLAVRMTSSVSSSPRTSSRHLNRRSPTSCWRRRSPREPAAHWHRRCRSTRVGWRCSKRSPVAVCSCSGSTTTPVGFAITSCSPNSYAVDSRATIPSGVSDCTAQRRHGSPNTATSTRPSTMRSRPMTRPWPLTFSSATSHVCSRSRK